MLDALVSLTSGVEPATLIVSVVLAILFLGVLSNVRVA